MSASQGLSNAPIKNRIIRVPSFQLWNPIGIAGIIIIFIIFPSILWRLVKSNYKSYNSEIWTQENGISEFNSFEKIVLVSATACRLQGCNQLFTANVYSNNHVTYRKTDYNKRQPTPGSTPFITNANLYNPYILNYNTPNTTWLQIATILHKFTCRKL